MNSCTVGEAAQEWADGMPVSATFRKQSCRGITKTWIFVFGLTIPVLGLELEDYTTAT